MSAGTLRDFFNMQSKTGLTPDRKVQIFANIQSQIKPTIRQTTSFSMIRNSWYFKTATTAALAFTLIYILYTPISAPLFQNQNNLLIARQGSVVQAGYVGDILATQGDINIVRNGVSTKTNKLQGGDVVYLYNTSKADFTLRDGSYGVVEGPAQLTIVEHADSGLILSVDHARYMQIDKASQDSETDATYEQLTIQTPTSRITTNKDDVVHLALVTTQDRQFVQNKGDSVTIESIVPNTASPVTQQLASSHVAEVTDSVKVYAEIAMIYDELKTQSTSQTYDLTSPDFTTDDVKSLLAFSEPSNEDVVRTKPTQIIYNITTDSSDINAEASGVLSKTTDTMVNSDVAPDTLFALTMSSDTTDFEMEKLSRGDTLVVGGVLAPDENLDDMSANNSGTNDVEIIANTTIKSPLTNQQIHIIMKYEGEVCISTIDLQQLQRSFDITIDISLAETISSIRGDLYLTDYLTSILSKLTICDTDNNDNQD